MAFFVGDLVVSVCGSCIHQAEAQDRLLLDLCVELSVGNKLHTIPLSVGDNGERDASCKTRTASPAAVAFHGVTEEDLLTITVLERSPSSTTTPVGRPAHPCPPTPPLRGPPLMAEAQPLRCVHWGAGGRPVRRTCVVALSDERQRWRFVGEEGETRDGCGEGDGDGDGAGDGRNGATQAWEGAEPEAEADGPAVSAAVSTVEVVICWSPAMRLRWPLSLVARAGSATGNMVSRKIDGPVAAFLHLAFFAVDKASGLLGLRNPGWWRTAVLVASAASVSVGSALLVAIAALFLPVALALSTVTAAALAVCLPPTLAFGWVLACTGPACEQLWRPLLVWLGTRWSFMREMLLLPVKLEGLSRGAEGREEGWEKGDCGVLLRGQEGSVVEGEESLCWNLSSPRKEGPSAAGGTNAMIRLDGEGGGGVGGVSGGVTDADAGAVVLLLACYQNLMGVLHTGLEASRWRPHRR